MQVVWASWSDLTKREIPNAAAVLLGLTAVVDAWIGGSPLQAGWLGCISILLVGFPVSAYLGLIGAGDIKLLAAAALWTSARTLDLLLITSLGRRRTCTFISLPEFSQNPQDD